MLKMFIAMLAHLEVTTSTLFLEPCGAYTKVNDYQRSTGFKISHSSQYYACDFAWRKGWYRFMSGAGGEMPTSCPDPYSCGKRSVFAMYCVLSYIF